MVDVSLPESPIAQAMSGGLGGWSLAPVVEWLFSEGRLRADGEAVLGELGERLVAAGSPVWRIRLSFRTLHPEVLAIGHSWMRGEGVFSRRVSHEMQLTDAFVGSPMARIYEEGMPIRKRLTELVEDVDHELFVEVRDAGGTDYLALPVAFADRVGGAITFSTDRPHGFHDADLVKLAALVEFLAPVLEGWSMNHVARSLLDTYVGPRTGQRVLEGRIRRGDAETIESAIWFSDLRDFTRLTESLPLEDLLGALNAYFELVAAAVTARGGEILRFIGDAMLIVFPLERGRAPGSACEAAVDAALDAFASLETLNHRRRRHGEAPIRFGVGLHYGTVIYGNVGAPDRLDFTVMGAAVNRTARLESLTKDVGVPLLVSEEMHAMLSSVRTASLGHHAMKGVAEPQEVFALSDHLAAAGIPE